MVRLTVTPDGQVMTNGLNLSAHPLYGRSDHGHHGLVDAMVNDDGAFCGAVAEAGPSWSLVTT